MSDLELTREGDDWLVAVRGAKTRTYAVMGCPDELRLVGKAIVNPVAGWKVPLQVTGETVTVLTRRRL